MRFDSQLSGMKCQTFSCGFNSGHFAGKRLPPDPDPGGTSVMLSGTCSLAEVCQPACSTSRTAC